MRTTTGSTISRLDAALVLLVVGLYGLATLLEQWLLLAVLFAVAAAVGRWRRAPAVFHAGVVACLPCAVAAALPQAMWPLPLLVALVGDLVLGALLGEMAFVRGWLRRGALDRRTLACIATTVIVAGTALVVWFVWAQPDYSHLRGTMIPDWPRPLLLLAVIGFAVVNAALEELVYRGVFLHALDAALPERANLALLLQAIAFGMAHLHGFPRGAVGVFLAAIYGLMMGTVRRVARGMLAPWIAHVFADAVIGTILVVALRS